MDSARSSELVEDEAPPRFDLKELVGYGVRRSGRWIALSVAVVGAIGLSVALLTPNSYPSEAKLLLRLGAREQLTAEVLVDGELAPREPRTTLQDELHLLQDEAIYEHVARALGPAEVLRPADPAADDDSETALAVRVFHFVQSLAFGLGHEPHSCGPGGCESCVRQAAKLLRERTELVAEPDSNVIVVRHTASSPGRARALTEALVNAFIERHAEQFSVEPYLDQNRDKLVDAQTRRDAAAQAWFDHVRECGLIDLETQRPALLGEVDVSERELFTAQVHRDEVQAERDALLERLKGSSSQIEVVRERAPNPAYLELKERIQDLGVEALATDVRVQRLEGHLAELRGRLDQLRECEHVHARLAQARDDEQARWQTLYRRFSRLEDLGGMDLREEANLRVLQPPTSSLEKTGPKRLKIFGGALAAGLLLGVWLATLRELLDRRLRYPRSIERVLGVRMLGVVPEVQRREAA